jgi:undecaprenol kinase
MVSAPAWGAGGCGFEPRHPDIIMKNKTLYQSFKNAYEGIKYSVLNQRNIKIMILFSFCAIFLGFYFRISLEKWLALIILMGLVLSLELLNTSIELLTDHISEKSFDPHIKKIKDTSAGAVLLIAFFSLVAGFLIFLK